MASVLQALESPAQNLNQMQDTIEPLKQFRPQLHSNFESRTDDTMDLLDTVCRYTGAKPMVELSLNSFLPRNYGRIHDNIQQFPCWCRTTVEENGS